MTPETTKTTDQPDESVAIFVARQPIFDRKSRIWGYELLFRSAAEAHEAQFDNSDQATSKVIADGFFMAKPGIESGAKMLINFPRNLLLEGAAYTLPKETCIIEILETVDPEPEILAALTDLKKAGYQLALDDYVGQPGFEQIIALADIVKVDIYGRNPQEVAAIVGGLRPYGVQLLAEKIEDRVIYRVCERLGFDFFQGFFFRKPEIIPGKKLGTGEMTKLQLLQELGKEDLDVRDIAEIIGRDISISYRLLRYINSAHFSPRFKIESITHALTMIGQRQLAQWLRVVLLADLDTTGNSQVVAMTSVQRAKFLELLTVSGSVAGYAPESMFLLGLFSMLETLLGIPMRELLEQLPLEEEIKRALVGDESPLRTWLELVEAYENAKWDTVERILKERRLWPIETSRQYIEAMKWTREILSPEPVVALNEAKPA
jgi:EAL and modified HD-GYP domain-containing signal transduction protein